MFTRFKSKLGQYCRDEAGNTTVDWVVLVAGILGMILIVMGSISGGVTIFGNNAGEDLASHQVGGNF